MKKIRTIPFGYSISNGKYITIYEEAEAVKQIFEQYISGKSLNEIAYNMMIPYHSVKQKWNKHMVKRVLDNQRYMGENGFPEIIKQDVFYEAQQLKSERNNYVSRKDEKAAEIADVSPAQYEVRYQQSVAVIRLTNKINQMLNMRDCDRETIKALILQCADEKYQCLKCIERGNENEQIQHSEIGSN